MDSIREAESATELEALCKQDSSWYPCQVSLRVPWFWTAYGCDLMSMPQLPSGFSATL
ncbi:hypothetical protein RchiOBHm_Chr3g0466991 [Rosa chinensis]|uniref:Uncharacterized protein n=1 Tax=Rosa chinensis TaxID=74649 RepID=A0A2P6RA52_ROSCH|nr:hypothetical protein RchiOBHm_Chr3g0466991 [Rosa chinensis]